MRGHGRFAEFRARFAPCAALAPSRETEAFHQRLAVIIHHEDIQIGSRQFRKEKGAETSYILIVIACNEIMSKLTNLRLRGSDQLRIVDEMS